MFLHCKKWIPAIIYFRTLILYRNRLPNLTEVKNENYICLTFSPVVLVMQFGKWFGFSQVSVFYMGTFKASSSLERVQSFPILEIIELIKLQIEWKWKALTWWSSWAACRAPLWDPASPPGVLDPPPHCRRGRDPKRRSERRWNGRGRWSERLKGQEMSLKWLKKLMNLPLPFFSPESPISAMVVHGR